MCGLYLGRKEKSEEVHKFTFAYVYKYVGDAMVACLCVRSVALFTNGTRRTKKVT